MDKSILSKLFMFAAGAAVGSVVTWKLVKTKYEQIANEEIESVKEVFQKRYDDLPDKENFNTKSERPESVDVATYISEKTGTDYGAAFDGKEEKPTVTNEPYVISPGELGDKDYEIINLTYYADGVLTDDRDNIIEDVDGMIGEGSLDRIGEYEDDALHVRDDVRRVDYEILVDERKSSQVYPQG